MFGKDFEETMQYVELVFKRLEKANLKLQPKKCRVFQTEVEYLGHIVSEKGIQMDPKKVSVVANTSECQRCEVIFGFSFLL